jgi:hypothetical protein
LERCGNDFSIRIQQIRSLSRRQAEKRPLAFSGISLRTDLWATPMHFDITA